MLYARYKLSKTMQCHGNTTKISSDKNNSGKTNEAMVGSQSHNPVVKVIPHGSLKFEF